MAVDRVTQLEAELAQAKAEAEAAAAETQSTGLHIRDVFKALIARAGFSEEQTQQFHAAVDETYPAEETTAAQEPTATVDTAGTEQG